MTQSQSDGSLVANLNGLTFQETLDSTCQQLELAIKAFAAVVVREQGKRIRLAVEFQTIMQGCDVFCTPESFHVIVLVSCCFGTFKTNLLACHSLLYLGKRCYDVIYTRLLPTCLFRRTVKTWPKPPPHVHLRT